MLKLNSFSLVATNEIKEEAAILIFALRKFHEQPIYLLCDTKTADFVNNFGCSDLVVDIDADDWDLVAAAQEFKSVRTENEYHRIDCIAKKMDALERATFLYGNTMFLDADIVPVARLDMNLTHQVMLSPHYHGNRPKQNRKKYGYYNAGYVFNARPELPDVWREIYRDRSTFYEQQGMIHFHEKFSVGKFSKRHNIGFWRFELEGGSIKPPPPTTVISFHAHLTDRMFVNADEGLTKVYREMKNRVLHYLANYHLDIFKFVEVANREGLFKDL